MSAWQIELPPKLIDVFSGPAIYRGAYGGRGSGKTRSFATMTAVRALMWAEAGVTGIILCAREYMNSLDESSMAEVKAAIDADPWLASKFDVGEKYIRTLDGRVSYAFVGLRHNLTSIKSKAKILLLWVDEAEPVSAAAWQTAIPTVREEESEIWVTWNPASKKSATHKRFRADPPAESKIVELNWRDNPRFPKILEKMRCEDLEKRPDQYDNVWEGGFVSIADGAYWAKDLALAKQQNRIGLYQPDPLMTFRTHWDIGGTGAKADACAIFVNQWIGRELRIVDYYEAVGQPLAAHIAWLRDKGYGKALCTLPHDGTTHDRVFDATFEGALTSAGFEVKVVPNQGPGAAKMRIEAARRLFPQITFNEATTEAARDAIGWYHEKRSDDDRNIGLGPAHDWSSHAADAFGLMCVDYEAPALEQKERQRRRQRGGWQGT